MSHHFGLGAPNVSPEDMRNYALCSALVDAGTLIKEGIVQAAHESANTQRKIASQNRTANYANTKMMVDAILNGSSYVERGLLQIASELRYSNILTERRDLETKIRSIEDWLFDKGFLKDFYKTAELGEKIIPFVNETYFYFLEKTCLIELSKNEKEEALSVCSVVELQEKLKAAKNELCRCSLNMMCHPIITLAYLISKNGIGMSKFNFYIAGTQYEWSVDSMEDSIEYQRQDNKIIYDFGEYKIVFERLFDSYYTKLTFEEALHHLIQVATNFEKWDGRREELKVRLEWETFFAELNMHIAMYNLRVLAQSLEAFKRQTQLEKL